MVAAVVIQRVRSVSVQPFHSISLSLLAINALVPIDSGKIVGNRQVAVINILIDRHMQRPFVFFDRAIEL